MKSIKKAFVIIVISIFVIVGWEVFLYVNSDKENLQEDNYVPSDDNSQSDNNSSSLVEGIRVNILTTGDNFMHESVIESGKQEDGTYNFDYIFEGIKDYLDASDIAILNQASVIGGNSLGVTGYPDFNSPEEICDAAQRAGFNIALMASNRVNSMGAEAIKNCINIWKKRAEKVTPVGIKGDAEDSEYVTITVKGIKIAILNYTYGLNNPLDLEDMYMVNFLGAVNETTGAVSDSILSAKVINQIETANETADFVIVFPCWGNEYEYTANDTQKTFAKAMVEAGADLIIGTHPHYLQEIEWVEADNGNSGLCYYSLGNLISSQNYAGTMLGGLGQVELVVRDGKVVIDSEKTGLIPIVTQYYYDGTQELADVEGVIPFSKYTEELAAAHGISLRGGIDFTFSELQYILNTYIDEKFLLE